MCFYSNSSLPPSSLDNTVLRGSLVLFTSRWRENTLPTLTPTATRCEHRFHPPGTMAPGAARTGTNWRLASQDPEQLAPRGRSAGMTRL